jgi:Ca2+-binding RTX toxin-like protein
VHSFDGGGAVLIGRAGNDELSGTPLADVLRGGAGRDTAWGRGGRDLFASIERRQE